MLSDPKKKARYDSGQDLEDGMMMSGRLAACDLGSSAFKVVSVDSNKTSFHSPNVICLFIIFFNWGREGIMVSLCANFPDNYLGK